MVGINIVEIVAVISAFGSIAAIVISALTNRAAARRDDLEGVQATVKLLQEENKRLSDKLARLEIMLEERDKYIAKLEQNNRDVTQSRLERIQYTRELEKQVEELQERLRVNK